MTRYTDNLWSDLVSEHGATITAADRPDPARPAVLRRPRVLAGSTLALAGAGTALALGLTAAGSTPAFAVTTDSDGSVLVTINQSSSLPQANVKLTAMGIHEQVTIYMKSGAAAAPGPVTCTPAPGVSGPTLKVLVGKNGSEVIKSGATGNNTGVGTWSLAKCTTTGDTASGNSGNTGSGHTGG